jgi:hypothetical protein
MTSLVLYNREVDGDYTAVAQIPTGITLPIGMDKMFELVSIASLGKADLVMADFTHAIFFELVFTKDTLLDCIDLLDSAQTNKDSLGLLTEILDGMLMTAAHMAAPA